MAVSNEVDKTNFTSTTSTTSIPTNNDENGGPGEYIAGVVLACLATLVATIAKAFLKARVNQMLEDAVDGKPKSTMKSNLLGACAILLLIINPAMDVAAFALAPASVVAASAGTSVLWNLLIAPRWLGEEWNRYDLVGAMLVLLGCGGIGMFGPRETPDYDYGDLMGFFETTRFAVFISIQLTLIVVLLVICHLPQIKVDADGPPLPRGKRACAMVQKLSWGTLAGTIGGAYFLVKAALALPGCPESDEVWEQPGSYGLIVGALLTPVLGVVYLSEGLKRYDLVFITPTYQGSLVVVGAAGGIGYFGELKDLTDEDIGAYLGSMGVIIFGMLVCLIWGGSLSKKKVDDDDEKTSKEAPDAVESTAEAGQDYPTNKGDSQMTCKISDEDKEFAIDI